MQARLECLVLDVQPAAGFLGRQPLDVAQHDRRPVDLRQFLDRFGNRRQLIHDARLRELFGIRTLHEWWPLDAGETVACEGFRGTLWSEELEPDGTAEETVPYKGRELDGLPAVLRKGRAWYVSTLPEPEALRGLLGSIAAGVGVRPVLDGLPEQVEAVRRGEVLFVLNHGREPVTVEVPGTHRDLLSGTDVTDRVTLGRYEAAVLRP